MALQSPVSEQLISDFENTDIAHLRWIHYVHHREQRILRGDLKLFWKKKQGGEGKHYWRQEGGVPFYLYASWKIKYLQESITWYL